MIRKVTTYYDILGLQPEVNALEIKRAYRRLAKDHHPDVKFHKTNNQADQANYFMARLNEAYETLIDKRKRADYDSRIGANGYGRSIKGKQPRSFSDDGEREAYLRQIFHPARQSMVSVLAQYKQKLADLSQDIFDDQLLATFETYVDEVEDGLRKASTTLSSRDIPRGMGAAEQTMRYAIAQAVDGLDELRRFCQNYDYEHLHMAVNLFKGANELSRKALQLTKS